MLLRIIFVNIITTLIIVNNRCILDFHCLYLLELITFQLESISSLQSSSYELNYTVVKFTLNVFDQYTTEHQAEHHCSHRLLN